MKEKQVGSKAGKAAAEQRAKAADGYFMRMEKVSRFSRLLPHFSVLTTLPVAMVELAKLCGHTVEHIRILAKKG